ncbi:MAG: FtsQ-type protein [Conexibacter sp.]|jgi:cell division protein FtsQ|nr:FtsQ-type protein [Conexibacter sp.]
MRRPTGRLPLPTISLPRRVPRRAIAGALVVALMLVPGWFLFRSSPLVGISDVTITGLSGTQATQIRQALEDAAKGMTTLTVDRQALQDAVSQFPIVASIKVSPHLLHRLDIEVIQHVPVAALVNGDRRMAVAGDGTILQGTLTKDLPLVPVNSPPGGTTLADPKAREMVSLLGAAPTALLPRISGVELADRGLVAHVSDGPDLYFGSPTELSAKWAAATRVLADAYSHGATYLDVRVPERPAAGGLEPTDPAGSTLDTQPEVQTVQ